MYDLTKANSLTILATADMLQIVRSSHSGTVEELLFPSMKNLILRYRLHLHYRCRIFQNSASSQYL